MPTPPSSATDTLGASTIARLNLKLIPFLMLLYLVAYIDRANISVAALQNWRAAIGIAARPGRRDGNRRTGERRLHLGAPLLAAGSLLIALYLGPATPRAVHAA